MDLTIGIPVFNEEQSIEFVLQRILSQEFIRKKNCEILVCLNNCTDLSEKIIKRIQKKNENIKIITENRQGKCFAVQKIFDKSKGNTIIVCDGDVLLKAKSIKELYQFISKNRKLVLVGGESVPLKYKNTLMEKLYSVADRSGFNELDKENNIFGCFFAIKKNAIRIPEVMSTDYYISAYFDMKSRETGKTLSTRCKDAIVYYNRPQTVIDFIKKKIRSRIKIMQIQRRYPEFAEYPYEGSLNLRKVIGRIDSSEIPFLLFYFAILKTADLIGATKYYFKFGRVGTGWTHIHSTKIDANDVTEVRD